MQYFIKYDSDNKLIIASAEGQAELSELLQMLRDIISLAKQENCSNILTDLRAAELNLTTMNIYTLPESVALEMFENGLDYHKIRRAFVAKKEQEDLKFYENVSINHGYQTHIFYDMDIAINWLLEK